MKLSLISILSVSLARFHTVLSFTTLNPATPWRNPIRTLHLQQTKLHLSTASTSQQSILPQGLTKTISNNGSGRPIRLGDIVTVQYHAYLPIQVESGDANNMIIPVTIAKSSPKQKVIVGDGMMVAGWDAALLSMTVGERAIVRIEDSVKFGYGEKGVPPIVPPNAPIEMDIQILDAEEAPRFVTASGMGNVGTEGSGEWSLLDPSKPVRTN
jgi:FK506-binding protein 1